MEKFKKLFLVAIMSNLIVINGNCQGFINGNLEGVINGVSSLPGDWQNVPYTDPNCLANHLGGDTPDLTDMDGPVSSLGYNGNPYSGNTFISGVFGMNSNQIEFGQEGIMQLVLGFTVESNYIIRFHQTVVKTIGALDKSGSWAVYIDTILIGVTTPTHSNEAFDSNNLPWEARSFMFTATSTSHVIKFLPMDDDTNYTVSTTDTTGALYMGIDSIGLEIVTGIDEIIYANNFQVFPNPNTGTFKLQYNGINNKKTMLYITDLYGKLIDTKEIINTSTDYENTSLTAGLYFYSLRQEDKEVWRGKFVVLK
jgi:hypothetical protein